MSFLGIYIILKLSFGVSTRGFLDFLLGGIGDGCDYTEQKRAYNVVFSNHINNKKRAQQLGLEYHEVFGLV